MLRVAFIGGFTALLVLAIVWFFAWLFLGDD